jgi:quinol monooxygenase YgiN
MSVLARFTPRSLTVQKYEEAVRRLEESGDWPPDGLEYHVFFGPDDDLRVSEIWDSQEQLEAFGEHLMPVLADIGIEPGEPELLEVHNIIKR